MHKSLVNIFFRGLDISLGREARETFEILDEIEKLDAKSAKLLAEIRRIL